MEKQLSELGSEYERVNAIFGRELNSDDLNKYYSSKRSLRCQSRELNRAEIGCGLSHLKAYGKLIEQKLPFALILEDDVIIPNEFEKALIHIESLINPERPEVLLLSPANGDFNKTSKIRNSAEYKAVPLKYGFYASSYIVTQPAAQSLLIEHTPLGMVIDNWKRMKDFKIADFFILIPELILQDQVTFGSSTTENFSWHPNPRSKLPYKIRRSRNMILDFFKSFWCRTFKPYNNVMKRK